MSQSDMTTQLFGRQFPVSSIGWLGGKHLGCGGSN